jgi:uncharacterized protein (TIGR00251 family)
MKTTETKNGTIVEVFVKPNSEKFEVALEGDEVVVRCTEEPVKGKVNKELLKALSKFFHTNVELVSGATSKQKRLLIKDTKKSEVERLLRKEGEELKDLFREIDEQNKGKKKPSEKEILDEIQAYRREKRTKQGA